MAVGATRPENILSINLLQRPSEESQQSTNAIGMIVEAESLDARCTRLKRGFDHSRIIENKISIRAMVDPGSSATIILLEKFKEIDMQMWIQPDSLKRPNLTLHDYSQKPISVGATVELTVK